MNAKRTSTQRAATTTQTRAPGWEGTDTAPTGVDAHSAPLTNAQTAQNAVGLSPLQLACVEWVRTGKGNGVLVAVAGAGKTTTLCAAAQAIPAGKRGYAVVFNKRNADELREKFPAHMRCGTFHSVWMQACRAQLGNGVVVDERKTQTLIEQVLPVERFVDRRTGRERVYVAPSHRDYVVPIKRLIGLAKNAGVGVLRDNSDTTFAELLDHHDIELDEGIVPARLIEYARTVLALSVRITPSTVIDFDDMLYMPLVHNWSVPRLDFVFVDEAQDTNALQIALVRKMVNEKGRILFVGDPHQAIYGFRGATSDAMESIAKAFDAHSMPLTVSYRCPQAIVGYAKQYVSHITAHENAPQGAVVRRADTLPRDVLNAGTAIVCRTTAPLVALAFALIKQRIGCKILGRDIGQRLQDVVKRTKAQDVESLFDALEVYREREEVRAESKKDPLITQTAVDTIESIHAVVGSLPPHAGIAEVLAAIDEIFTSAAGRMLALCTVHKSKGLEWDTVVIVRPDLMPMPGVKKKWQLEQEKNLAYVAATRAKQTLIVVSGKAPAVEDKKQQAEAAPF